MEDILIAVIIILSAQGSPARREDLIEVTDGSQLPLKFVDHPWLENVPVIARALSVWPAGIVQYVQAVWKKKIPHPGNKPFDVISTAVNNNLLKAKLLYIKSLSCVIPTLRIFRPTAKWCPSWVMPADSSEDTHAHLLANTPILALLWWKNDWKWVKMVVFDHYFKRYSHNPI